MNEKNNQTGLNCPKCQFKIKFTMENLLRDTHIECPACNLIMEMNVPTVLKEHIQEIALAEKMVRNAQNFSG